MQTKLKPLFWMDCICAAALPIMVWWCYSDLVCGDTVAAAFIGATVIWNVWAVRRLPDCILTMFCFWWIKRKTTHAMAFLDSLSEDRKNDTP